MSSQPANAFAPGSIVDKALSGGLPGISVPGFSSSSSSSAKSGDLSSLFSNDASGFSVNYGSGVGVAGGAGTPSIAMFGGLLLVGYLLWKKKSS